MIIKSAKFMSSATKPGNYPPPELPEIAFAGRSNVGKSSLINSLLKRKKLVKTSSTPGRTQLLNFFEVNESLVFVDLPGYGYAKVSKEMRKKWGQMIETFITTRKTLHGVVLILDLRRIPGGQERENLAWFDLNNIPVILVATKADKFSRQRQLAQQKEMAKALGIPLDVIHVFSAKTGQGRDELWESILDLCEIDDFEQGDDDNV
ncbi:ribosome biogenesis GTP-binding protein YihA/YsxC [Desulfatibacillum aliphaticivorans]|uniref:Probable GTP-binding protein EngB n=1 Tax=Desulfatibacillum aliphaticivorans TaxID=218208 RepID=ENGB_DESAL|nr:ribosome biogenesis GTP-binding protein YihA/YsxC [Desulfatibacillum aliphaticivorans]B8FLF0.1 RecName: Full=Probable GTP-binding protein EngB [Desulfatibacillum aliphaticivorans]ACL05096.1 small GTP-binding protein [Desulfatibacillum aliphaticivorans]